MRKNAETGLFPELQKKGSGNRLVMELIAVMAKALMKKPDVISALITHGTVKRFP